MSVCRRRSQREAPREEAHNPVRNPSMAINAGPLTVHATFRTIWYDYPSGWFDPSDYTPTPLTCFNLGDVSVDPAWGVVLLCSRVGEGLPSWAGD